MSSDRTIAVRCPSCGSAEIEILGRPPFATEFRCHHCGGTAVLIIDQELVPLSRLQKEGDKICPQCGRIETRDARYCQAGHSLFQWCHFLDCGKEYPAHHHRCDFCGRSGALDSIDFVYDGHITRLVEFGAFVRLTGGTEGFLHVSEIAERGEAVRVLATLKVGQPMRVRVIQKDPTGIRLSLRGLGDGAVPGADGR